MIPTIIQALRAISHPRFFETERGFQGEFLANLKTLGAAPPNAIVEEEHQKKLRIHGIARRPDIIIHVPTPPGGDRKRDNFAVFALKLAAGPAAAAKDFAALDAMIVALHYRVAAFVNIAARDTHADRYNGQFRDRLHFFGVAQVNNETRVRYQFYQDGALVEE